MAERPSACGTCNKRLNRKHWYYRHNAYFCSKACWKTAEAKAEKETAEKAEKANTDPAPQEQAKAEAPSTSPA
jgi:hypothetical protein